MRTIRLAVVLLATGCAALRPAPPAPAPSPDDVALEEARAEARAGHPRAARAAYSAILAHEPPGPVAEEALWGLALLLVDPQSPLCDYHAAVSAFDRLADVYPHGPHAEEVRAWRAALRRLVRHEREVARLRGDLEQLRALDEQMEGSR